MKKMSSVDKYLNRKKDLIDEIMDLLDYISNLDEDRREAKDRIDYLKFKVRWIDLEIDKIKKNE